MLGPSPLGAGVHFGSADSLPQEHPGGRLVTMVGGLSFSVGKKLTPFQKHKKEEEDKKRVQIPHAPSLPPRP